MTNYLKPALLAIIAASSFGVGHAATQLYFTSTPGAYVGGGMTKTVTSVEDGGIFNVLAYATFGGAYTVDFQNNGSDYSEGFWWTVDFAPPAGEELAVGLYLGATRFPFQDPEDPGLWFYGDGRGYNMSAGYFSILDVAFGEFGELESLALDFLQYGEGSTTEYEWGSLRYKSDIALTLSPILNPSEVPLPSAALLLGPVLAGLGLRRHLARLVTLK
ncbi:hypothetical protein [Parvularcula sp. LCG005]|uniref:hypothetical protein n=1 Tax=Parvularcula sp. LCG005 TaxID=3078805 RepID=UPI002942AF38|nr:hypothetical protein [Parvularcula sp. LCG005]WOI53415.1 hypothetical protein RUI03_00125 [Parvularcula sp. LCG005]